MRYQSAGQFAGFDNLEDRRELVYLWQQAFKRSPEILARQQRAEFLASLLAESNTQLAHLAMMVKPCSAQEAYFLMVAIVTALGVPMKTAVAKLERLVRYGR